MGNLTVQEIETRRNDLLGRMKDLIKEGEEGGFCSSFDDCRYVMNDFNEGNMGLAEGEGYVENVCDKYNKACELNYNSNNN